MRITGVKTVKIQIRTSSAILLGLAIFLIILIASGLVYIRALALNPEKERPILIDSFKPYSETPINLPDQVSQIVLEGIWECDVYYSETPSFSLLLPSGGNSSNYLWEAEGTRLTLKSINMEMKDWEKAKASIGIPSLTSLENRGVLDILIRDFTEKDLFILSNGMADIRGDNNRIETLKLNIPGAGSTDFRDSEITNAEIQMSGVGSVQLNMNGGFLKGTLSGMGSIEYSGTVSRNTIKTTGLGSVEKK